jgi:serine/threonine-protein kinase
MIVLPFALQMPGHGRYTIVGKLADGGMAEIFLALQHGAEGFEKPVVLKRILTAFSADPQFRNMFLDEAHISMSLSHSNIVQVLDLGVSNGRYFLALELVDGWDLDRILERSDAAKMAWPPALSVYVTTEICRALAYAHGKTRDGKPLGIVHRDISPNNVLISEQGEVKLADFGIAKAQRKREKTAAGVIKGKVAFMSPEQALGGAIDRRSDLFSVGSLLYLMVTKRLPFESPSDFESMLRVQRAEFEAPEKVKPEISPALSRVIMRAMRLSPPERYQTADEMLADLERVLRAEYHSAGQTELKLWLAQLARRDEAPTIGKTRAGVVDTTIDEGGGTALNVGTSFELGDLDMASGLTALSPGTPPPVAHPLPAFSPVPQPSGDTSIDRRPLPPRKSRVFLPFLLGAGFTLAAVIGLRDLARWAGGERGLGPSDATRASADDAVAPPVATASPDSAAVRHEEVVVPPPPAAAPGVPDASALAVAASPASAKPEGQAHPEGEAEGEDEEALLREVVPDPQAAVIGEEEAEPSAKLPGSEPGVAAAAVAPDRPEAPEAAARAEPKVAAGKVATPPPTSPPPAAPTPAKAPASSRAETVSLKITSRPVGAVVKTKHKVLGRTPISLRFKSGNTYELTFVKRGYTSAKKRVAISGSKDRRLAVSLKKQRPQRRSIFRLNLNPRR